MPAAHDVRQTFQWRSTLPFLIAGSVAIIGGGLAAAVTGPTEWEDGSWVAAFLVLVMGVSQIGLSIGQALLAPVAASTRIARAECVLWNTGSAAVVVGTLSAAPIGVCVGGALLVVCLALFAAEVRDPAGRSVVRGVYCAFLALLGVSVLIGSVLAWRGA